MKHDPDLMRLLLLSARDGGYEAEIAKYSAELVIAQKARLVEEGLADAAVIRDRGAIKWVKNFRLNPAGHAWLEKLEIAQSKPAMFLSTSSSIRIFISHSSADADLAEALAELLEKALRLDHKEIRCTSVAGYRLPVGVEIDLQLRTEIEESEVLIALVTANALASTYVLFELGARWVLRKPLFPLLGKGTNASALKEPLKARAALSCDDRVQVRTLLEAVANELALTPIEASASEKAISRVVAASKNPDPIVAPPKSSHGVGSDFPELSATEIFSLQAIAGGVSTVPIAEEIIADNLGISIARSRQALESVRKKGLVTCRPNKSGLISYELTLQGRVWLETQVSGS